MKGLLTGSALCQDHYQILLNIYQKNFIEISAQIVRLFLTISQQRMMSWILGVLSVKENCKKNFFREWIIYKLCNGDINKFISLLRNWVHPYEYVDSWETFDETSTSYKEDVSYSNLNIKDIIYADYRHATKYVKTIWYKQSRWLSWFFAEYDTVLLADVFENFRNKCIEIYELDSTHLVEKIST